MRADKMERNQVPHPAYDGKYCYLMNKPCESATHTVKDSNDSCVVCLKLLHEATPPPEPEYCYYKVKYCTDTVNHNCHMCREFNTRYKGRFN